MLEPDELYDGGVPTPIICKKCEKPLKFGKDPNFCYFCGEFLGGIIKPQPAHLGFLNEVDLGIAAVALTE